jgi:hypothetical protein
VPGVGRGGRLAHVLLEVGRVHRGAARAASEAVALLTCRRQANELPRRVIISAKESQIENLALVDTIRRWLRGYKLTVISFKLRTCAGLGGCAADVEKGP